jgi:integrase
MAKGLTAIAIRNLKPGPERREIPDGHGLYVVVHPTGKKSFAVRYRLNGKPAKLTLDRGLSLAEARVAAAKVFIEVERGRDPNASKHQAKAAKALADADTFQAVAEEYMKREGGRLRSADWRRGVLERLVYETLGAQPIADIKRSDIIRLLDKIEAGELKRKGKPVKGGVVMADRARRHPPGHELARDPVGRFQIADRARHGAGERERVGAVADSLAELCAVWKATDGAGPFGSLVRFLLLTAARRTEASAMTWGELDGADWTLPAARNKAKQDLLRPLSSAAQAVLSAQPRIGDYVFSNTGRAPLSGYTLPKRALDAGSGVTGWTLHDLRRTARSLMSRAGVNADHAERCLGHVIQGVRSVYDRHSFAREKAQAFDALAAQIERITNPPASNVTALRG